MGRVVWRRDPALSLIYTYAFLQLSIFTVCTMCWGLYVDTCINFHNNHRGRYSQYCHFTEEVIEAHKLMPKVTQLVSGRARIWTQAVHLQSWCSLPLFFVPIFIFRTPSLLSFRLITLVGLIEQYLMLNLIFQLLNDHLSLTEEIHQLCSGSLEAFSEIGSVWVSQKHIKWYNNIITNSFTTLILYC